MGNSSCLSELIKRDTNKIIYIKALEEAKEEIYDSPKTNLDIINKNLIRNVNHSNNTGMIIKAKKRVNLKI